MSRESRILAGVLLIVIPTVMCGGLPREDYDRLQLRLDVSAISEK
jgi:hypothetical protein